MKPDYTLGGRLDPPSPAEAIAPRDEDDDLLEQLCTKLYDLILSSTDSTQAAGERALKKQILAVSLRQHYRTSALLRPLYEEEPRQWYKLRPLQHAQARRIRLVHQAEMKPKTIVMDALLKRVDEVIARHSS